MPTQTPSQAPPEAQTQERRFQGQGRIGHTGRDPGVSRSYLEFPVGGNKRIMIEADYWRAHEKASVVTIVRLGIRDARNIERQYGPFGVAAAVASLLHRVTIL